MKRRIITGSVAAMSIMLAMALVGCQEHSVLATGNTPEEKAAPKGDSESVEVDASMSANLKVEMVRQETLPRVLTATGKIQL